MKYFASVLLLALSVHAQLPNAPTELEAMIVTASILPRTLFEQAQPALILNGDELKLRLQPTLGETLSSTPGISSTYFGPAASRPVIRGLDADRVRVLQNGSNTIDASATSVDHAVSFDPISVDAIEVVRGPATLLYGPNAIGGVVNVIDNRMPDERIESPVRGTTETRYGSVNTERGGAFTLEGGVRGFNYHIDGYKRATDDLHIPGFARSERLRRIEPLGDGEHEAHDVLPNSNLRTEGLSGGGSYVWENGYFGAAYSGFHTNYGTVAERTVTIDVEQRRLDVRGAFFTPFAGVKSIKYNLGVSDYEHTESEGALTGTIFENEGHDARIEITHQKFGLLEGAIGFQSEKSNFSALGEEAFLPTVETKLNSAFLFEEIDLKPVRLQFGLRYDHSLAEADANLTFGPARNRDFDNLSGSTGVVWTVTPAYAVAVSLAATQRAPTYQELFANGPHVATHAFEIGDASLGREQAFSLDLSLRKKTGRITGAISVFYNRFENFIGQFPTGKFVEDEEEALPILAYRATDARFFGGELDLTVHLIEPAEDQPEITSKNGKTITTPNKPVRSQSLDLNFKADFVHAEDIRTDQPLPRIPPFRGSAGLNYRYDRFSAAIEGQYTAHTSRIADTELATDSHFLLSASIGYRVPLGRVEADIYIKGTNLSDQEARVHTSFLKDIAPLPGRSVLIGIRTVF